MFNCSKSVNKKHMEMESNTEEMVMDIKYLLMDRHKSSNRKAIIINLKRIFEASCSHNLIKCFFDEGVLSFLLEEISLLNYLEIKYV